MAAVFAVAFGAAFGSFLNVIIDRLPAGKSLVFPPSSCDHCGTRLRGTDMVPIFSYLWLRGKCRTCSAKIPVRVLFVELSTGALVLGLFLQHGMSPEFFVLSVIFMVLIVVTFIDVYHQLILNIVTYPAALAALLLAFFWPELGFPRTYLGHDGALASFYNSLSVGFIAFSIFLVLAMVARLGYGDVKLVLVLGLLLGYPATIVALWLGIVAGGLWGIGLLLFKKKSRQDAIPFGPFLAGGAIAAFFLLEWITVRHQEYGLGGFLL